MNNIKIFLIIVVSLTQILIVIFPFLGKISDNRRKRFRRFTNLGYGLICCCILSLSASFMLIKISQDEEDFNKNALTKALIQRDSINQSKIDNANKNLYEAFAKYGLKYDIAEKRISKLVKDSARINIITGEKPLLIVTNIKTVLQANKIKFELTFSSKMATSYIVEIFCDGIQFDSIDNKYNYIKKNIEILNSNTQIPNDGSMVISQTLNNPNPNIKYYIFHIRGVYRQSDGKIIKLNKFYCVDMSKHKPQFGEPGSDMIKELYKFTKEFK